MLTALAYRRTQISQTAIHSGRRRGGVPEHHHRLRRPWPLAAGARPARAGHGALHPGHGGRQSRQPTSILAATPLRPGPHRGGRHRLYHGRCARAGARRAVRQSGGGSPQQATTQLPSATLPKGSNSNRPSTLLDRSLLYYTTGRTDEALGDYDWMLRARPERHDLGHERGTILMSLGRTADRRADIATTIRLRPTKAPQRLPRGIGRDPSALSDVVATCSLHVPRRQCAARPRGASTQSVASTR